MHDYRRERVIATDPKQLYAYLSDVAHLPEYFARLRSAELVTEEEVHTQAVVEGPGDQIQEVSGTAWFRRDDRAQQIQWGSEGENNYHGQLTVSESGDGSSRVVLEIHTESDHDGIHDGIDETLSAVEAAAHA